MICVIAIIYILDYNWFKNKFYCTKLDLSKRLQKLSQTYTLNDTQKAFKRSKIKNKFVC